MFASPTDSNDMSGTAYSKRTMQTHRIAHVDPLRGVALDELAADEVPGVASGRARSLPLLGDLLGLRPCSRAQTTEWGFGSRRGRERAE